MLWSVNIFLVDQFYCSWRRRLSKHLFIILSLMDTISGCSIELWFSFPKTRRFFFELLHIYIRGPHKCVLYFRWSDVSQFWAVFATNHKQSYATVFNSGSVPQLQRLLSSNLLVLFTESRKRYGAKVVFLFCVQSCEGLLQTIAFSKRIRLLFTV